MAQHFGCGFFGMLLHTVRLAYNVRKSCNPCRSWWLLHNGVHTGERASSVCVGMGDELCSIASHVATSLGGAEEQSMLITGALTPLARQLSVACGICRLYVTDCVYFDCAAAALIALGASTQCSCAHSAIRAASNYPCGADLVTQRCFLPPARRAKPSCDYNTLRVL